MKQKELWHRDYANPWNRGTLSTAGNLVFQGTADGRFIAYDARSQGQGVGVGVGVGVDLTQRDKSGCHFNRIFDPRSTVEE